MNLTVATLPGLGSIEVVSGHVHTPLAPQLCADYSIRMIERGHGQLTLRRSRTLSGTAEPRRLLIVAPGDVLSSRPSSDDGWTIRRLRFAPPLWWHVEPDAPEIAPCFADPRQPSPRLVSTFVQAHRALERGATLLEQSALLTRLLCALRRQATFGATRLVRREHAAVARAKDYLRDRLAERVTLSEVAAEVRLSPYHLLETFRHATGIPVHQYQIHLRIARARTLLAGGASVTRVALETGFADQSHLGRYFKRIMGVTPGAYAAAWRRARAGDAIGQGLGRAEPAGHSPPRKRSSAG